MITTQARSDGFLPAVCFNRSERILIGDNGYCYKTRGGEIVGTFATEAEAMYDLNQFIERALLEKELQDIKKL